MNHTYTYAFITHYEETVAKWFKSVTGKNYLRPIMVCGEVIIILLDFYLGYTSL